MQFLPDHGGLGLQFRLPGKALARVIRLARNAWKIQELGLLTRVRQRRYLLIQVDRKALLDTVEFGFSVTLVQWFKYGIE